MKKNRLIVLAALLFTCFGNLYAQNYFFIFEQGTLPPYAYDETQYSFDIATSGNDVLSSWQTLPFSWSFYGQSVTGYFASDNGYITFDQSATTSEPSNTTIPNSGGPNNAIYAFWDDLDYGSGRIRAWDYGVAPNRIHCIQWDNMSRAGTNARITATLRIHESGKFDIIHDLSSGGTALTTNGTVGVENATGTLANQLQSAPMTQFPSLTSDYIDDYVYGYTYGTQHQYDLSVQTTDIKPAIAAGTYTLSGRIKNYGSSAVSTFDLKYQVDNGPVMSDGTNTLILVPNGGEYGYFHADQLNLPTAGSFYTLKIWCDNLNGNPDENHTNDTLTLDIVTVLGVNAPKKVVVEEFTATWCGACPTGLAYMDSLYTNFPNQVIGVANHSSDAFSFTTNNTLAEYYGVSGIPTGMVDRSGNPFGALPLIYPTSWPNAFAARLNEPCPVAVEVYSTYNWTTRQVDGQIVMNFVDYALGDMRAILYVTEDDLPGTQSGIGAYTFNHILRALPLGEFGTTGLIPNLVNPNTNFVQNFSFTLPANIDPNKVHLAGAVQRYNIEKRKHEVLNANSAGLDNGVSAASPTSETRSLGISPNPSNSLAAIQVEFAKPTTARFSMFNAMGQQIKLLKEGRFAAGNHHVWFNVAELPAGVYYINVNSDLGNFTEKLIVAK